MREAARIYRFSWWQRFIQIELPFAAIGLVWNSMMSVAGGWFSLMACEMFVLGCVISACRGSVLILQTAASSGDTRSIFWGVGTMIAVIVLIDQFVWRPVIAWAEKFKIEQVESSHAPSSWVLNMLQLGLHILGKKVLVPIRECLTSYFARRQQVQLPDNPGSCHHPARPERLSCSL